jgi:peroxiredoxin
MTAALPSQSLAECLAAHADELRSSGSPYAEQYDNLVARLRAGAIGSRAPGIGDIMPDFMLPDQSGRIVTLTGLLGDGPVVVSLNRGHWCPFCRMELDALDRSHEELAALDARVVSIMPDRQPFTRDLARRFGHPLTILTDMDNDYALSLGLALWIGRDLKAMMAADDLPLDAYHGNDAWVLPLPATFVVARNGRVAARYIDPDFRRRMAVEAILTALR